MTSENDCDQGDQTINVTDRDQGPPAETPEMPPDRQSKPPPPPRMPNLSLGTVRSSLINRWTPASAGAALFHRSCVFPAFRCVTPTVRPEASHMRVQSIGRYEMIGRATMGTGSRCAVSEGSRGVDIVFFTGVRGPPTGTDLRTDV
jgi:hypothetical protein